MGFTTLPAFKTWILIAICISMVLFESSVDGGRKSNRPKEEEEEASSTVSALRKLVQAHSILQQIGMNPKAEANIQMVIEKMRRGGAKEK